jgi:ParB family chromosome partitioning protein
MGKADDLLRTMGGAIFESASRRGAPAAMPATTAAQASGPDRLAGVTRSKAALEIPVSRIAPDPDQPREEFDEDALRRLADSLATKGQLQPISVRWAEDRGLYMIIAGERRWRAAGMAGLATISCVVVDRPIPPGEMLAIQCIENLLREDLRPIEQAKAFRTLMEVNAWSGNQLAKELGVSQPAVVAALKLLSLPEPIQGLVDGGELSASSASAIATLDSPEIQAEVAARVVSEGLSRAETIEAVKRASPSGKAGASKGRGAKPSKAVVKMLRTPNGRVTVELRKGLDVGELAATLRQALEMLEPADSAAA